MMEWLDVILGAGVTAVGVGIGVWRERRRRPRDPQPICGCGHHYSQHDDAGCHETIRNSDTGWNTRECACKRYTGPEPLPTYIP